MSWLSRLEDAIFGDNDEDQGRQEPEPETSSSGQNFSRDPRVITDKEGNTIGSRMLDGNNDGDPTTGDSNGAAPGGGYSKDPRCAARYRDVRGILLAVAAGFLNQIVQVFERLPYLFRTVSFRHSSRLSFVQVSEICVLPSASPKDCSPRGRSGVCSDIIGPLRPVSGYIGSIGHSLRSFLQRGVEPMLTCCLYYFPVVRVHSPFCAADRRRGAPLVGAGFPATATLLTVMFKINEMTTSAGEVVYLN